MWPCGNLQGNDNAICSLLNSLPIRCLKILIKTNANAEVIKSFSRGVFGQLWNLLDFATEWEVSELLKHNVGSSLRNIKLKTHNFSYFWRGSIWQFLIFSERRAPVQKFVVSTSAEFDECNQPFAKFWQGKFKISAGCINTKAPFIF
jgi:hypothetical protein